MKRSVTTAGLLLASVLASGCSGSAGAPSLPLHQTQAASSAAASSNAAGSARGSGSPHPQNLIAGPVRLSAYPISLSAFPISLSAYPLSQGTVGLNSTPTQPCSGANAQTAGCTVVKLTPSQPVTANTPVNSLAGYLPVHLQGAYGLTGAAQQSGGGMTVAIVTTGSNASTINSDLAVYRNTMNLPPCTLASGCLHVVNASSNPPVTNNAWSEETAVDTEMVSAICPLCSILVVLANSSSIADLSHGVVVAASYHPVAISNSYAVPEASDNAAYASNYNQPGIAVLAGGGDTGYGVNFPASAPTVVAVGGTTLQQDSQGHFYTQALWSQTGSGCSQFFQKPAWQTDSGCLMRTANDIAAIADPAHGVAGYSSAGGGWNVYGGTSVATPIVAAMYGLVGPGLHYPSDLYNNGGFAQVAPLGSNGTCAVAYLCSVVQGAKYSAPVGMGVPNGTGPFQSRGPSPTAQPSGTPSLSIEQTSNGPWTYGQNNAQYTISVDNNGIGATGGPITVAETLPAGFSWNGGGVGANATCSANGNQLTCTLNAVIAGQSSQTLTIQSSVASSGLGSSVTAIASAYGGGDPVHNAPASAVTTSTLTYIGLPSLAISLASNPSPNPWTYGETNSQYVVAISNVGYGQTSGPIAFNVVLPAGITAQTGSGNSVNAGGGASCSATGQQVNCTSSNAININQTTNFNIPVTVATGGLPSSVTATSSVYGGGDPVHSSASSANVTTVTTPIGLPTLSVTATSNGPWYYTDNQAQYTIAVANSGQGPTGGTVSVNLALPQAVNTGGFSAGGINCSGGPSVTCTLSNAINAGQTQTFNLPVQIANNFTSSEMATMSVYGGGDIVHTNSQSSATGSLQTQFAWPSLSLSESTNGTWGYGQNVQYTLAISELTAAATYGPITFTATLPSDFIWNGQNAGPFNCSENGQQVLTCTSSQPINGNQTQNVQVQGTLPLSGLPSSMSSSSTLYGGGDPVHTNPQAALSSSVTTPIVFPSLSVSVSAQGGQWYIGQTNAQYQIRVANTGAGPTGGRVTVTDTLPRGLTLSENNPGGGFTCSANGSQIICTTTAAINGNSTQNLNLPVTFGGGTPASITDVGSVYGGGDLSHPTAASAATGSLTLSVSPSAP